MNSTLTDMHDLFFELIQVAIGRREKISRTLTSQEWETLYRMAESQAVLGICFFGVKRIKETQTEMPLSLFMEWVAMAAIIYQKNKDMDRKSAELWTFLNKAGLDCAILKGQGIAELYGVVKEELGIGNDTLGMLRQSGDIDVWVKGGFDVVNDFVQKTQPTKDIAYHRFHYNMYADTEVELHHRPTLMRNLFDDRRLQRWCDSFGADTFVMTDKGFKVPSFEFNRIFILTHIYKHYLFEGIGLRQLMDYYYVLKASSQPSPAREDEIRLIKRIGMKRFTAAVMWVLGHVFGLEKEYMLCAPDAKEGQFILDEIMQTGNFGQGDRRYKGYGKMRRMSKHGMHLLIHYPSEVLWTPVWLVYHKVWKYRKIKQINI